MKLRTSAAVCLFILPLVISSLVSTSPMVYDMTDSARHDNSALDDPINEPEHPNSGSRSYSLSELQSGELDPVLIEHQGNRTSGQITGRTDTNDNAFVNMTIDNSTGWAADEAKVSLSNLQREYAVNGTFDEGVDGNNTYPSTGDAYPNGWNTDWYESSGGDQVLRTYYDADEGYAAVESIGYEDTTPYITYWHYDGTYVLWNQTVQNVPYSDNMTLDFRYNYDSGIIDEDVVLSGYVLLVAYINDSFYILADLLTECPSRNTWFDISLSNITDMPSSFEFGVGIYIYNGGSGYFETNPAEDYDNDGLIDGEYARIFRVLLDDVTLHSVDPVGLEEVELRFHAGDFNTSLSGTSQFASAEITYQYWEASYLTVGFTSNVSVSFDYQVWLLSHYFVNSSYQPHPTKKGVSYSIDLNASASLSSYLYLGSDKTAEYENYNLFMYPPSDWMNVTVYDPFSNDVTSTCTVSAGSITIPASILDRLGWWEIDFESQNYAKDIATQIYDSIILDWSNETLYRSTNVTRVMVELGTSSVNMGSVEGLNLTWTDPDSTVWSEDSISGTNGVAYSSSRTFGGTNTTAGTWTITLYWTNGTELAYSSISIDLYHTAQLSLYYGSLSADQGQTVSNYVDFTDSDNGAYLLDDSVNIVANWSGGSVDFYAEPINNRWKADFDTSLVEGGIYTIVVNASRPYFDNVSVVFTIEVTFTTDFSLLNVVDGEVQNEVHSIFVLEVHYELGNGTVIPDAQVSVSYSGRESGLSIGTDTYNGDGNYSVEITALLPGEYSVTITLSKDYYYDGEESFVLVVDDISTTLTSLNGTADSVGFGLEYRLVLHYSNATEIGIDGADVNVTEITPSTGISTGDTNYEGDGNYSIVFTPSTADIYTIVIRANISDHETRFITFTLIVNDIPTVLVPDSSGATISIDQNYTLQLTYEDEISTGIEDADITVPNLPSGLSYEVTQVGGGVYNVTLIPSVTETTSFQISFKANLTNYQTSGTAFSLFVQVIPTSLNVISGEAVESISIISKYQVVLSYLRTDLNENITLADITLSITPSSGISYSMFAVGDAYGLEFTANTEGLWQILVTANRTFYESSTVQLQLTVSPIDTDFICLNGTLDSMAFGESYQLVFNYENSTGTGLVGANVTITESSPDSGITIGSTDDKGTGIYNILLTPTTSGSFSFVIRANLTNHTTQYVSFSLVVLPISTILTPHVSGATVSVDKNFTLQLRYEDEETNGIIDANITVVNLPGGLDYEVLELTDGLYNITFVPLVSTSKTFELSLRASKTNYLSAGTAFTLQVQIIPTSLLLLEGDTSGSALIVDDYSIVLSYVRTDTNANITGAGISVVTNPSTGLLYAVEMFEEAYRISFSGTTVDLWQITITASKNQHATASIAIELDIDLIDTELLGLNGTADQLDYGGGYRLCFRFTNNTDGGITNATLDATEISPTLGLTAENAIDEGDGYYSLLLVPNFSGSYSVVVKANLTNHTTRYFTFTLVVTPIQTTLNTDVNTATITVDENYLVSLLYESEEGGIEGANIEVLDIPSNLTYSVTPCDSGYYNVALTPSVKETTTFQISIRASLTNYQSATTEFSLLVRVVPTEIRIYHGSDSMDMKVLDEGTVVFGYVRTDSGMNVSSAEITISIAPSTGLTVEVSEIDDLYQLTVKTEKTGLWQISISVNKTSFLNAALLLEVEVSNIETSINTYSLVEPLFYGRPYSFEFSYLMENGSSVRNANISISGIDDSWVTVEELSSGIYNVTVLLQDLGHFDIALEFSRVGFHSKSSTLSVDAIAVTIEIVDLQGTSGIEGQTSIISLRLVESDTGNPVTGADVVIQLYLNLVREETIILEETADGVYSGTYTIPSSDYEVSIRIFFDKINHEYTDAAEYFEYAIVPTVSSATAMYRTLTFSAPFLVLGVALVAGYAIRRSLNRRKWKANRAALAIKRRFDDVRNLLGVVVLHRDSGIPLYSRMLRGGFDENLISAFITAITQFRGEFDVQQKEWEVIPVSDIIMTVRTVNLVCAFITIANPSTSQQEQMVRFARAIGFVFDSVFEDVPLEVIDKETEAKFDELFEEMLDVKLHLKYKIITTKDLPSGPKCMDGVISDLEGEGVVDLDDMAEKIASCGLEEARVYKIIWDAIEAKHLIPVEGDDGMVRVESEVYGIEPRLDDESVEIEAFDIEGDEETP